VLPDRLSGRRLGLEEVVARGSARPRVRGLRATPVRVAAQQRGLRPAARRRHPRRQPALGEVGRCLVEGRPPGRGRQDRGAARVVRRGRGRGRHPLAAEHRQPVPPGG